MKLLTYKGLITPKLVKSVVLNSLYYLNLIRKRSHIVPFIGWDLTYRCNGVCNSCKRYLLPHNKELSTKDKIKIINQFGQLDLPVLSLSGGEIALLDDFDEILHAIIKNKIKFNVNTNGTVIPSNLKLLLQASTLTVSIDSLIPNVFHNLRGYDLNLVLNNVKKIRRKINIGKYQTKLIARMTINESNHSEIVSLYDGLRNIFDEIIYQPAHNDSNSYFQANVSSVDSDLVKSQFKKLSLKNSIYGTSYYRDFHKYYSESEKTFDNCLSYFLFLEIDPYGNLYNCGGNKIKIGNLKETSFEVLMLDKSKEKIIKSNNKTCKCYYNCAVLNKKMNFLNVINFKK